MSDDSSGRVDEAASIKVRFTELFIRSFYGFGFSISFLESIVALVLV
jgi:hypothetical protein